MQPLSGVSLDSVASVGKRAFREATLFTHRGLSGPAVLQISSYWREGPVTLDLLPGQDAAAFLLARKRLRPKGELRTGLAGGLPARLPAAWAPEAEGKRLANVPDRALAAVAARLSGWRVTPTGTEGFAKAE